VTSRLAALPDSPRPRVLHIAGFPPLVVDGGGSVVDLWIPVVGATNAMGDVTGFNIRLTPEELLKRDPDVLIIQAPGGHQGQIAGSARSVLSALAKEIPVWSDLKAVRSNRVY
jgi:iron complex transport system substrate-binding protein